MHSVSITESWTHVWIFSDSLLDIFYTALGAGVCILGSTELFGTQPCCSSMLLVSSSVCRSFWHKFSSAIMQSFSHFWYQVQWFWPTSVRLTILSIRSTPPHSTRSSVGWNIYQHWLTVLYMSYLSPLSKVGEGIHCKCSETHFLCKFLFPLLFLQSHPERLHCLIRGRDKAGMWGAGSGPALLMVNRTSLVPAPAAAWGLVKPRLSSRIK